ncbi:MAG: cold shock domain-containing protein [Candidatus Thiodiazotropha sp.]
MKIHGNLKKWNDDRGFGFIDSPQSSDEIFVHISEFPKEGGRPKLGELISFEIQTDHRGKKRAIKIQRTGRNAPNKKQPQKIYHKKNPPSLITGLSFLALAALGYVAYSQFEKNINIKNGVESRKDPTFGHSKSKFECDGRQHCSQMTSRAEAEFFLANCPNTKMDGDHDGIPCENDSRF